MTIDVCGPEYPVKPTSYGRNGMERMPYKFMGIFALLAVSPMAQSIPSRQQDSHCLEET